MASTELKAKIQDQIKSSHVLLYCKTTCSFCHRVRSVLFMLECCVMLCNFCYNIAIYIELATIIDLHIYILYIRICECFILFSCFLQVKQLFKVHCVDYTPVELDLLGRCQLF
jgi:glutaredoxin